MTAQEMYERDKVAIQTTGLSGSMLMENAGRAVSDDVETKIEKHQSVIVLIGGGNNGGDGYVIARTLLNRGYQVEAWQVVSDHKIQGDALLHKEIFIKSGYPLQQLEELGTLEESLEQADVVIDSMLGIGVKGQLRPPFKEVVALVNKRAAYTIAVDIPTGVPADESVSEFDGLFANHTTVIAAPKISVFLEHTSSYYGEWTVVDIGLPTKKIPNSRRKLWGKSDTLSTFPTRQAHSHKGSHGKGIVVGGSFQMPGSIAMTAKAALRSGIGLLTIATTSNTVPLIAPFLQEATFQQVTEEGGFLSSANVVDWSQYNGAAIGMGMGRNQGSTTLVEEIFDCVEGPLLIDADGLYLMKDGLTQYSKRKDPTILTPHPGEFAHLIDRSIPEVMQSPFCLTRDFALQYGVYVVLKGPSTIITSPRGEQCVEVSGNAGLAKGGSGDVLSGILLALLLQSNSVFDALANGCMIHGLTAERLTESRHSIYDLLATDLIEGLPNTFRTFSSST
ncbi:NAD(P)H-hydrate dehydratase [Halobacillus seohaensis]|uniref:Bifunctional NAD(P)H-hydrate repair enzyme n=1 Tax=Halobacillus seohaensis TaxID=447421 RepID=A0ABW2ER18_9BACI